MMFSSGVIRSGASDVGLAPLPAINTVLSHRDELDPMLHWPQSLGFFDGGQEMPEYLNSSINTLETFTDAWREDECLSLLSSRTGGDEGKTKVEKAAALLNISTDPEAWSREEVLQWLKHSMRCNHSSPGLIVEGDWMVDGRGLCDMTPQDFIMRLPKDGVVLYTELELWKTVQMTSGYAFSALSGPFSDDFPKDPILYSSPSYAVLESAVDSFPSSTNVLIANGQSDSPHLLEPKYIIHQNLLQADPNLQQVTAGCNQLHFDTKMNYWDNNNNNNGTSNNNTNNRDQMYAIVKAEHTDDIQSTVDENSWPMHSAVTSSTNFYQENKPKVNGRKWTLARLSSDGVSSAMPDTVATPSHRRGKRTICLWQFLKELLQAPHLYSQAIRWIDREKGVFKIEDSVRVARLWGERKNRPAMNYDKLSRSIRQYYKKGIIQKTTNSKRLVYQFCPQYK